MLVKYRWTEKLYRPTSISTDYQPSVARLSTECRPSVDRVLTATSTDIPVDLGVDRAVDATYSKHDPWIFQASLRNSKIAFITARIITLPGRACCWYAYVCVCYPWKSSTQEGHTTDCQFKLPPYISNLCEELHLSRYLINSQGHEPLWGCRMLLASLLIITITVKDSFFLRYRHSSELPHCRQVLLPLQITPNDRYLTFFSQFVEQFALKSRQQLGLSTGLLNYQSFETQWTFLVRDEPW